MEVAIVGATGAVGLEFLRVLETSKLKVGRLRLFASARSAGKTLAFRGQEVAVESLVDEHCFVGVKLALFSAGSSVSAEWAPRAVASGCVVVDNASHFRLDPNVPLVVPEVNGDDLRMHKGIVANPNCTTAITLMALFPLHRRFRCKRVFASSYQAVSGTGARAIEELRLQVEAIGSGQKAPSPQVYPHQIAFNVIPQVDVMQPNGYTKEELKMLNEGRKILHHPEFRASVTCVRVPVYRAHCVAVSAEFEERVSLDEARRVLREMPGLDVLDDTLPMPLDRANLHNVAVGRLRIDCAFDNGLCFFVCGDQILKGAALNAIQIAERMDEMGLLAH